VTNFFDGCDIRQVNQTVAQLIEQIPAIIQITHVFLSCIFRFIYHISIGLSNWMFSFI